MKKRTLLRPAARQDIDKLYLYIKDDSVEAADRFWNAVWQTIDNLTLMPQIGHAGKYHHRRADEIRHWPIHGFRRYMILYPPLKDGIDVIRVLHAARDIPTVLENDA